MRPYEYGGKLWYKDNTMNDWKVGGTLTANNQQLSGAEFSGSQLGTPDYAMKLKGVTYCHATAGNSSDKRIVMAYIIPRKPATVSLFPTTVVELATLHQEQPILHIKQ